MAAAIGGIFIDQLRCVVVRYWVTQTKGIEMVLSEKARIAELEIRMDKLVAEVDRVVDEVNSVVQQVGDRFSVAFQGLEVVDLKAISAIGLAMLPMATNEEDKKKMKDEIEKHGYVIQEAQEKLRELKRKIGVKE